MENVTENAKTPRALKKSKVLRENGDWETITVKFPFGDVMSDYSFMELYPALTTDRKKNHSMIFRKRRQ